MPEFQKQIKGIDQRSVNFAGPEGVAPTTAEVLAPQAEALLAGMGTGYAQGSAESLVGADEENVNALVSGAFAEHRDELTSLESTSESVRGVYDKAVSGTLDTQKRIQAAIDQGVMTSAAGNARMQALRKEKLSNPIVSMFQSDFDKSFSSMTGAGARGAYFGQTAEEVRQAEVQKQQNSAFAKKQTTLTQMVDDGIAPSKQAAEELYNKIQSDKTKLDYFTTQDALGKLGHSEAVQKYELENLERNNMLTQATMDYVNAEGNVEQTKAFTDMLTGSREQSKYRISVSNMTQPNKDAALKRLNAQYDSIEKVAADKTLTKDLEAATNQATARMQNKGINTLVDTMKLLPELEYAYALSGNNPANLASMMELVTADKGIAGAFAKALDPVHRAFEATSAEQQSTFKAETVGAIMGQGGVMSPEAAALYGPMLTQESMPELLSKQWAKDPASVIKKIDQGTGIRLQDINRSRAYKGIAAKQPDLIDAIVTRGGREVMNMTLGAPTTLKVSQDKPRAGNTIASMGTGRYSGKTPVPTEWKIETGGFEVPDMYKEQVVSAYRLGVQFPKIWDKTHPSLDAWLSSKFTLPAQSDDAALQAWADEQEPEATPVVAPAPEDTFMKELQGMEGFSGDGEYDLDGVKFFVKDGKVVQ
jgi:hypothetical protein